MNFLQICERITEELDGIPLSFSSVDLGKAGGALIVPDPVRRQAIRAAQLAFDWVMDFSRHWEFMSQRGRIFDLEVGIREYWKPWIESVQWDSLYLTQAGTDARWPVYEMQYDAWQRQEQAEIPSEGYPTYLISAPADYWIVGPTPSAVWTLNGNWQYKKSRLISASDEPPWDERYHDLIVWLAVMQLDQVKEESKLLSPAQRAYNSMWPGFLTEYLPKFRGAHALA